MTFHVGWPQAIYLILVLVSLGVNIERHGKSRTVTENAWTSAIATVLVVALLMWGGFFR